MRGGRAALVLALALACDRAPKVRAAPVEVRLVHDLGSARVQQDLRAHPQLTLRYVATDGEYDRGVDAGAVTFTYVTDGGAPREQAHQTRLAPGTYRLEACLEAPGGDGCKTRPADYLASPALSGQSLFTVPAQGGTLQVRWGNLNPSAPDARPADAPPPADVGALRPDAARAEAAKKPRRR